MTKTNQFLVSFLSGWIIALIVGNYLWDDGYEFRNNQLSFLGIVVVSFFALYGFLQVVRNFQGERWDIRSQSRSNCNAQNAIKGGKKDWAKLAARHTKLARNPNLTPDEREVARNSAAKANAMVNLRAMQRSLVTTKRPGRSSDQPDKS